MANYSGRNMMAVPLVADMVACCYSHVLANAPRMPQNNHLTISAVLVVLQILQPVSAAFAAAKFHLE